MLDGDQFSGKPNSVELRLVFKAAQMGDEFERAKHLRFLKQCLKVLPGPYASQESNRMTLAYFVVSSLDVLGELDQISASDRAQYIDWIYAQQVHPDPSSPNPTALCGFRGTPFLGDPFNPNHNPDVQPASPEYNKSNIAMTYTALLLLRILGDDYSRVNRVAVLAGLRGLQQPDGSYAPVAGGAECDMRFVYCACAICEMLGDWSGIDKEAATNFIVNSQSYDGGIAQGPLQEAHGGSTYCAVAALYLMGHLSSIKRMGDLVTWCVYRQVTGFQGRINKAVDTCYSFWIGAALQLLGYHSLCDHGAIRAYSLSCQHPAIGGISKWPDTFPDVLHTYFSLCGLSFCSEPGLMPVDPALGMTLRAAGDWTNTRPLIKQYDVSTL